nr:hypothetical protein [Neorhizobium tomejilense]
MMIIDVPICYYAHGRRAGKKISAAHHFLEDLRLELPVFDDSDAPVAVEWEDPPPPRHMFQRDYWGEDDIPLGVEHVRILEGKFFRPLRFKDLGHQKDIDAVSSGQFIGAAGIGLEGGFLKLPKLQEGKKTSADIHFETVHSSGREAVVRPILEAVSKLIVVGGMVYIRCEEPFICVWNASFDTDRTRPGPATFWRGAVARVVTSMPARQVLISMELFPVQRFREAVIRTKRMNVANAHNKQALEDFNARQAPRMNPDSYYHPDQLAASECRIWVRTFLHSVGDRRDAVLPLSDTRKLRLYYELANALEALPDEAAMQAIESAGNEWLDTYGPYRELHDLEEEALRQAVEIAGNRPVHVAEIGRPVLRRP